MLVTRKRRTATRRALLVVTMLAALSTLAPSARAAEPEAIYGTAVASHPAGWLAVADWEFYRYNGDLEGFQRVLRLDGVDANGEATAPTSREINAGWGTSGPHNARNPSIAFNGTNFLVVWEDDRNGSVDIYGALVSPTGDIVRELALSRASGDQLAPRVAGLGGQFLVVWQDHRVGASADIYGTRVSAGGTVSNPSAGIKLAAAAGLQANPAVAANGSQWLVVWNDKRNAAATGVDIYSTRVSSGGGVANPAGVAVSTAGRDQFKPVVTWNGTSFLAAWTDSRRSSSAWDIFGTGISSTGAVLNPSGIAISTAAGRQSQAAVSRSGSRAWVSWTNDTSSVAGADPTLGTWISGRFVASTGSLSAVVDVTAPDHYATSLPAASAVNGTLFVAYRLTGDLFDELHGQRVSSAGALVGERYDFCPGCG